MRGFKLESLELVCAVIVTAGLVAGNLLLFFPFQHDNRFKTPSGPSSPAQSPGLRVPDS